MAESDSITDQWLETQRRYWDAWMDMTRKGMMTGTMTDKGMNAPWSQSIDQWWKAVSPSAPKGTQDFFDQMINVGKSYFSMMEDIMGGKVNKTGTEAIERWTRQLSDAFEMASNGAMKASPDMFNPIVSFWTAPFEQWNKASYTSIPFAGDFMKAFNTTGISDDMQAQFNRLLSMPPVGFSREAIQQQQQMQKLMLAYQKASQDYHSNLAKAGMRSVDSFKKRLDAAAKEEKPINSMRQVFNVWVDACEEIYAEYALSDEYAKLYGEMVNSLMAVKQHGSKMLDEWLESMNMPTRTEVDTLQKRLHETRRELRALRAEINRLAGQHQSTAVSTADAVANAVSSSKATTSSTVDEVVDLAQDHDDEGFDDKDSTDNQKKSRSPRRKNA